MGREEETALVEQYICLVQKTAARRFSSRLPDDDLIQSGMIGLWEAAQRWNGKGEFEPFARVCIYHNMLDYVRGLNAKGRDGEEIKEDFTLDPDGINDLDIMELIDDINKAWPRDSFENELLRRLAVGYDKRLVAAEMGLTTYQATRIAKRAYKRVQSVREQRNSTG